jgi:hypothetical protein
MNRHDSPNVNIPLVLNPISQLCIVCYDIDFDRFLSEKIAEPIRLGTWGRIIGSRQCPFCCLVFKSLRPHDAATPRSVRNQIFLANEVSWKLGVEISPYALSRSESYSNKFDLRSIANKCEGTAYRFLVYRQSDLANKQCIQYLADRDRSAFQHFFGRSVDARVNIDLLKGWLSSCRESHSSRDFGGKCEEDGPAVGDLPDNLRLIDVGELQGEECIIRANNTQNLQYIALSYVWGENLMWIKPSILIRDNIRITARGERTPIPQPIPRTIKDSIDLTRELGFQYLWVDALCIVQDDNEEEKQQHLSKMGAIYGHAVLTIAAGAGDHADHGLPGIGIPRTPSQYKQVVNGLPFATMSPSYTSLENSNRLPWNKRGWTLQEKLLSKRILLFTDTQIYFKCSESIWTEEIHMETPKLSNSVESMRGKYRWSLDKDRFQHTKNSEEGTDQSFDLSRFLREVAYLPITPSINPTLRDRGDNQYLGAFPAYAAAVREYTRRTLANPDKDVLVAIKGIFQTIKKWTGRFYQGIPEKFFLDGLLWYPEVGASVIRANTTVPSWSWAGWRFQGAGVSFSFRDIRALNAWFSSSHSRGPGWDVLEHFLSKLMQGDDDKSKWASIKKKIQQLHAVTSFPDDEQPSSFNTTLHSFLPFLVKSMEKELADPDPSTVEDFPNAMDWAIRSLANLVWSFGEALVSNGHTIKNITYVNNNFSKDLVFEVPMDSTPESSFLHYVFRGAEWWERKTARIEPDEVFIPRMPVSYIVVQTVVVRFKIGELLRSNEPNDEDCAAMFQLLDEENNLWEKSSPRTQ